MYILYVFVVYFFLIKNLRRFFVILYFYNNYNIYNRDDFFCDRHPPGYVLPYFT